ncbi:MAG: hypothetical protein SPD11_07780 [Sphaerochaetaceae bacterium]|nr:hypothetical protein [Sphaerochaetaceae bacterium]
MQIYHDGTSLIIVFAYLHQKAGELQATATTLSLEVLATGDYGKSSPWIPLAKLVFNV